MGERIFVVEDDENIREIINLALVSNGYEVVQFDNAINALAEIDKKAPSLAIFDLMLPKMSKELMQSRKFVKLIVNYLS